MKRVKKLTVREFQQRGGLARARNLSRAERVRIAKLGAKARWTTKR